MAMGWSDKVKELMRVKNINQKELSLLSGITEASVSRYLTGERTPRMDIIINFAKALDVSVEYLLEENNSKAYKNSAYDNIAVAIARDGNNLTAEEMNKLIELILARGRIKCEEVKFFINNEEMS